MSYVPHTDAERLAMIERIGVGSIADLFADIPPGVRDPRLDLPEALSEPLLEREAAALAARNHVVPAERCFLGAGVYRHYLPATVDDVLRRSEFYTAYTPYQPELSHGMLQAMFEYQSLVCRLTGMEVSNASHYDGATALAEAVLMALDIAAARVGRVLVSPTLNPGWREVLRTYLGGRDAHVVAASSAEPVHLSREIDAGTAAVVVQNPDFLGRLHDLRGLADAVHANGALLIVAADPISLGLFEPPGAYGADVVVADGQPLGLPPSFGGPHLGIFATRRRYIRRSVGRLVGETVDSRGERAYVLTLATREQHIRRAHATSNICTNAALGALAASVYLATMGRAGLRHVAELCHHKARHAARRIGERHGFPVNPHAPDAPFFREFVVELPCAADAVNRRLLDSHDMLGGYPLATAYPDDAAAANRMLVAVTEMHTAGDIEAFVDALGEACRG